MNEFVEQFLIEGRELVAQGNDDLLALEERPDDRERLDGAFRAFHTLKGAAGIVDFVAMSRALHAAEDVLSAVRSNTAPVTPALINLCLACLDQVSVWIDRMRSNGEVPADADAEADDLVRRFATLASPDSAPLAPHDAADATKRAEASTGLSAIGRELLEAQKLMLSEPATEDAAAARLESASRIAANVLRHHGRSLDATDLEGPLQSSLVAGNAEAMIEAIDRILEGLAERPPEQPGTLAPQAPEATLRVDVDRIDTLVRLTGELLIAKNAIGHSAERAADEGDPRALAVALKNQHLALDRLVSELQRAVFSLRVLPLQHAFQRFPRLVREMATALRKPARLMIEGATIEADKTIVEAISEPLLHVLRNGLDHGLEEAAERAALGKPATATIHLRAERQGEHVVIEVEDDGRGVDVARVRDVARQRNAAPEAAIAAMSDEEAINLIFAPGFSTVSQVTDLSGRGVGMDIVRNTVERLGGRVSVSSQRQRGTTVRFTLPFTVMMTQVLTVEAAGQVFGVPMEAVVETVRVGRSAISPVGAARAMVLRDRTLPVIDLGQALGRGARAPEGDTNVLIVAVAGQLGGLEVDRLGDRMDVMLKPPEGLLAGIPGIDGTTLLGDGRVLIVLDLGEIFGNADD
ncbi:chemotaxis protein CheA [Reyranella soli]|nr:chemotaxis protein CheA [Reyranella soli]